MSSPAQEPQAIQDFNEPIAGSPDVAAQMITEEDLNAVKLHGEMSGNPINVAELSRVVGHDVTSSPAQTGPRQIDFYEALQHVADGLKITRVDWCDPRIYVYLVHDFLMIRKANGTDHILHVQLGDLVAEDWVVL